MTTIHRGRMTAELDGEFVVFLIGMRINRPWAVRSWLPVVLAMPRMIRELHADPELGFLGSQGGPTVMVQYWRSFEHLERYARSRDHAHLPAWADFNRRVHASDGAVGIWHETYRVAPGAYETLYGWMPAFGLGKAGRLVPVGAGRGSARERMRGEAAEVVEA
jgi:hypothetical protein